MQAGRILVTGATGFVGRQVVACLLERGAEVVAAVRSLSRRPPNWAGTSRLAVFETGDLHAGSKTGRLLEGVDAVVHLAGLAHVTAARDGTSEQAFMEANAGATQALAVAARGCGLRAFVHMSSLAAIVPNALDATIDDSTDIGPSTPYGHSKRQAERHVEALARSGTFAVSLRPPLVVGAEAPGNWASLQSLAWTGAPLPFASVRNRRGFIGAEALAEAVGLLCMREWPVELSGNYCLADPELLSLPEVVRLLRAGMGKPARLFPFPARFIEAIGALAGRQRQIGGLTGDLRIDPSRFVHVFGNPLTISIRDEIIRSGAGFASMRGGGRP